jgi:catalase
MRGVCGDDIVAHSTDGFPVRTGGEFLAFLRAAHPPAQRFGDTPKPIPTSFAREASFAVTAFTFTNAAGVSRHGRFCVRPDAGTVYLSDADAAAKPADFLGDELAPRPAQEPVTLGVLGQLVEPGDDGAEAGVPWPDSRPEIPFGTVTLTARVDDQVPDRRRIILDPVPRVDGIEASGGSAPGRALRHHYRG